MCIRDRRLPGAQAMRETMRRRRASGGPAEQAFATVVGLELRPRQLRAAAELWALLEQERGAAGRDAVWSHPDLIPTAEDLEDPAAFVRSSGESSDPIAELEKQMQADADAKAAGEDQPDGSKPDGPKPDGPEPDDDGGPGASAGPAGS